VAQAFRPAIAALKRCAFFKTVCPPPPRPHRLRREHTNLGPVSRADSRAGAVGYPRGSVWCPDGVLLLRGTVGGAGRRGEAVPSIRICPKWRRGL